MPDPIDLVFGSDGHLYVSSGISSAVYQLDGATGALIDDDFASGGGLDVAGGVRFGNGIDWELDSLEGRWSDWLTPLSVHRGRISTLQRRFPITPLRLPADRRGWKSPGR